MSHAPNSPSQRQDGDNQATPFDRGLVEFMPALKAFACSLARDVTHAEDLVQETLLRALMNRDKFREGSNLLAWLFTILRNLFLSEIRRKKSLSGILPQIQARGCPVAPAAQEDYLSLRELALAVDALPDPQRRAVTMVGVLGYSYEETALSENCAIGTVKSRVNRARASLGRLSDR